MLQKKVRSLEEENLKMRYDMVELRQTTDSMEEKEEQLMQDCLKELGTVLVSKMIRDSGFRIANVYTGIKC